MLRSSLAVATALAAILVAPSPARAQSQFPATPAGRAFEAWLKSFNSGDPEAVSGFHERFDPQRATGFMAPMRAHTGGFALIAIERSEPRLVTFVVKEKRNNGDRARGTLRLHDSEAGVVAAFELFVIGQNSPATQPRMDVAGRARVIEAAAARLVDNYVFPDVAKRMEAVLRQHLSSGKYDDVADGRTFADLLTSDLREVSKDKHLQIRFLDVANPDSSVSRSVIVEHKQLQAINCGFVKAERLDTNVGYVKLNLFGDPRLCGPTASAAMQFIANTDAVILDLRDNGGGEPDMVAYLSSYLFTGTVHLNDLWTRAKNTTRQFWTLPYVAGARLADKPVFVLTSSRTFSAAEEFAYNLQALKRALIVGETTGGGAHPVAGFRLDDQFAISVPVARAVNPVSGRNWEGTGVQPDVMCDAADALTTAEQLALTRNVRAQ